MATAVPGFYTPDQVAELHGVDRSTVCRWISKGLLAAVDLGHQKLIEQGEAHKFVRPKPGNPAFKSKPDSDLGESEKSA